MRGLQRPLRELDEDFAGEPGLLDGFWPTTKPILTDCGNLFEVVSFQYWVNLKFPWSGKTHTIDLRMQASMNRVLYES